MASATDSPYKPPESGSGSGTAPSSSQATLKRTYVVVAILLQLITGGFYGTYWYLSRRRPLAVLAPSDTLPLSVCLTFAAFNVVLFASQLVAIDPALVVVVQLGSAVSGLFLAFSTKSILEGLYNASFSAVFTFLFNFLYLQYKINEYGQPNLEDDGTPVSPASLGLSLR